MTTFSTRLFRNMPTKCSSSLRLLFATAVPINILVCLVYKYNKCAHAAKKNINGVIPRARFVFFLVFLSFLPIFSSTRSPQNVGLIGRGLSRGRSSSGGSASCFFQYDTRRSRLLSVNHCCCATA